MRRVALFGWGVVAPKAANLSEFTENLRCAESWLEPFNGFGPDNFLVGTPKFDFGAYEGWISERFPPSRFRQLADKMDPTTLYAIGAFIQCLDQNPGLEAELQALGAKAHVYIGTALGPYPTLYAGALAHDKAQRRWNRFWADPKRNAALRRYLNGEAPELGTRLHSPQDAEDPDERRDLEDAWNAYWAPLSSDLGTYLGELREIEGVSVGADVGAGKLGVIREKRRRLANLKASWRAPEPPWNEVSASLLWNLPNTPAAEISMLARITGLAFCPAGACSSFGIALKLGIDAIRHGDARLVVIGASDPPPHPLSVGTFYQARVLAADGAVSKPLSGLRGTHVAGGAAVWILGDLEYGLAKGFSTVGMEPISVGVSSDAEHIITPSRQGPRAAIRSALAQADVAPSDIRAWDLHATATPGDFQEVENLKELVPDSVLVTARKGTFGHGMGAGGGWELTAQYLGLTLGTVFPTPLRESELHAGIRELGRHFVFDTGVSMPAGVAGKLSMGIGGINACVISRPW